jgi:MtN3 and saliva related transmembrane protein
MVLRYTIATIVPITTSIQLLPQLYKTYQTKSVDDLSLYTLLLILINNLLWLIHGYFIFDYSLILSGIFSLIINTTLFIFYMIYSKYPIKNEL